jgi:hypothetical protein
LEHVASVSTVEKEAKQEISIKQTESFSWFSLDCKALCPRS